MRLLPALLAVLVGAAVLAAPGALTRAAETVGDEPRSPDSAAGVAQPAPIKTSRSKSSFSKAILGHLDGKYDLVRVVRERSGRTHHHLSEKLHVFHAAGHPSEEAKHPTFSRFSFQAMGETFDMELEKNHVLMHPDYAEYRLSDGGEVVEVKTREEVTNCYYLGHIRSHKERGDWSSVAVDTCNGLRGVIHTEDESYQIEPAALHFEPAAAKSRSFSVENDDHIVFKLSDVPHPPRKCGNDHVDHSMEAFPGMTTQSKIDGFKGAGHDHDHDHDGHGHDYDYDPATAFRPPASGKLALGSKWIEILGVNDFPRFSDLQFDTEVDTNALFNMVASHYLDSSNLEGDNFRILLVAQVTFTDQMTQDANAAQVLTGSSEVAVSSYLGAISSYRMSIQSIPSDNTQLLSGSPFQDNVVGLAWRGAICDSEQSTGINQVTHSAAFDSATIAHELGHNLGGCHDPPAPRDNDCGNVAAVSDQCEGFIMSSVSDISNAANRFSPCTNVDFDTRLSVAGPCLTEPSPIRLWLNSSVCGDGFITGDELCDCRGEADCSTAVAPFTDPCCDGATCTLLASNECSDLQACCSDCMIVTDTSTVCRAKETDCDIEEKCDGMNAVCPFDEFEGDDKNACETGAVAWIKENWRLIAWGAGAVVAIAIVVCIMKRILLCCCGDVDDVATRRAKLKRQRALQRAREQRQGRAGGAGGREGARGKVRPQQNRRPPAPARQQQQQQQDYELPQLPAHWQVRFDHNGMPTYYNTQTQEVYSFS